MVFCSHFRKTEDNRTEIQTVTDHCRNTAFYAKSMLEPVGLSNTGYLAGLVHDAGKMKQEFQQYLLEGKGVRGSVNHTFAGCRLILSLFHTDRASTCEDLTAELIAFAAGAHHGLFDCVDSEGKFGFVHRMTKEKIGYSESEKNFLEYCADVGELTCLFHSANAELMPIYQCINDMAGDCGNEFSFYTGLLARLFLSAVIDADRRDTAEFMTGKSHSFKEEDTSKFWEPYLANVEERLKLFPKDTPIQKARAEISKRCCDFAKQPGGIIRLSVPTGGGKTLSSLRYALHHAKKWGKRRLIFTLPLLTILEQNVKEIRQALGDDKIVLEHHSNVVETNTASELDVRELAIESWDSPVIVTTLVQLLNVLFAGKTTAIRRFQSLCNSVIIIDEVQTVPSRMLSLFNLAMNFLAKICGATVILCSATQPNLKNVTHRICPQPLTMIPYDKVLWEPFKRTKIVNAGTMQMEETVNFIRSSIQEVQSLLVICNKKDQAAYLFEMLDGTAEVCCHLSAAMCPKHREQTVQQLHQALDSNKSCLCIATQVIEAGVDISFQRVIRMTAGLDNIVQSAGRCNRNAEEENSPVYIITLCDENLTRLEEIKKAKQATVSLLGAYQREPNKFDFDLASDAAVNYYYDTFYGAMPDGAQDYRLEKEKTSVFALLSDNRDYCNDAYESSGKFFLNQAFRTAGDAFTVFDNDTYDVVVPFGEGKKLIDELLSHDEMDVNFLKQWIKKAKHYTVSLYDYQIREMSDVINEYAAVKLLPSEYYDERFGFTMSPKNLNFWEV